MMLMDADVLVVGGGPAGSATAARLAESGLDVQLVDKARFPREKPCGEFFSPGVVAALERLGALETVLARPNSRPVGMRVTAGRDAFMVDYARAAARSDGVRGGLAIARTHLDSALLDHAKSRGVHVEEGTRVGEVVVKDGRVTGVRARLRDGATAELRAGVVVAADGANSAVARSLGLVRQPSWPRRLGLAARYEDVPMDGRTGEMHVGEGLYCGIASVGGGAVAVGLAAPVGVKQPGESADALFERLLSRLPSAAERLAAGRRVGSIRGVGPLACGVAKSGGPGFLLVGDAAGFLDPFTGEGVHRALLGAELAAKATIAALARDDGLPVGYERARTAAFGRKEVVCLLVQHLLARPALFRYVLRRLDARDQAARLLSGVLGDYLLPQTVLTPGFVWELLRP